MNYSCHYPQFHHPLKLHLGFALDLIAQYFPNFFPAKFLFLSNLVVFFISAINYIRKLKAMKAS